MMLAFKETAFAFGLSLLAALASSGCVASAASAGEEDAVDQAQSADVSAPAQNPSPWAGAYTQTGVTAPGAPDMSGQAAAVPPGAAPPTGWTDQNGTCNCGGSAPPLETQSTPTQGSPVQQTPVQETPVQGTPVQGAPGIGGVGGVGGIAGGVGAPCVCAPCTGPAIWGPFPGIQLLGYFGGLALCYRW
jgi:hypothetical protein